MIAPHGIADVVAPKIIGAEVGAAVTGRQGTEAASHPSGVARLDDIAVDAEAEKVEN